MNSHLAPEFRGLFGALPEHVQRIARRNYRLWRRNPLHASLGFKRVGTRYPVYAVRIGIGWRALGLREADAIIWFWIGSHAEYDRIVRQLR